MKDIWIIRHAKSSWKDPSLDDFSRPLNKRGFRDAPFMAGLLAGKDPGIECIITSPANRAKTTARYFQDALDIPDDRFLESEQLYHAGLRDLLSEIYRIPEQYARAILAGHNPGFTELVNHLSGGGIDNVPTCAIAHIRSLSEYWSTFDAGKCTMVDYMYPKMYQK